MEKTARAQLIDVFHMMTPVGTETPNKARNPYPGDDTLKLVAPSTMASSRPPEPAPLWTNQQSPLEGFKPGIKIIKIRQM